MRHVKCRTLNLTMVVCMEPYEPSYLYFLPRHLPRGPVLLPTLPTKSKKKLNVGSHSIQPDSEEKLVIQGSHMISGTRSCLRYSGAIVESTRYFDKSPTGYLTRSPMSDFIVVFFVIAIRQLHFKEILKYWEG